MSTSNKMITFKTSDGKTFEVEEAVARQSETIASSIQHDCIENGFPLANVCSKILPKVIEYCEKHVVDGDDSLSAEKKEELKMFDAEYMKINQSLIFDLMLTANYLDVEGLLKLTCQTLANTIASCKTGAEIRDKLNIKIEYTPEEEAQVLRENQWAFE